jgi:hypothetical protein
MKFNWGGNGLGLSVTEFMRESLMVTAPKSRVIWEPSETSGNRGGGPRPENTPRVPRHPGPVFHADDRFCD